MAIFLIAAGAILLFAITTGSPHGLNVHIVGIILILAGVLGLLLPASTRGRLRRPGLLRIRWVSPGRAVAQEGPPAAADPGGYYDESPPLADDLPG